MQAYITLLSTPSYLPGVLCLARSLRATGARHRLLVALSAGLPPACEQALHRQQLQTLRMPPEPLVPLHRPSDGLHRWAFTFDKLHLFGLTQFSKLVYLDSDMMIMDNIDHLFGKPHMSAVAAGRLLHPQWTRLNSGLMVVEPQRGLAQRIAATLDQTMRDAAAQAQVALGDQDLINAFYPEWPQSRHMQLDDGYNIFHTHLDAYLARGYHLPGVTPARSEGPPIRVIHFIGPLKPWTPKAVGKHWLGRLRRTVSPVEQATFRMYRRLLAERVPAHPAHP